MTPRRREDARLYCRRIGADPDELIKGWVKYHGEPGFWVEAPRWSFYMGAPLD